MKTVVVRAVNSMIEVWLFRKRIKLLRKIDVTSHSPNPHPSMLPGLGWLVGSAIRLGLETNFSLQTYNLPSLLESPRTCHNTDAGFPGPSNRSIIPATCTTPPEVDNTADHVPTFQPPIECSVKPRPPSLTAYAIIAAKSPLDPANSFSSTTGAATPSY